MSLLKAERHEADIAESGKVFHRTTHDGIFEDKNLAVDEMENSTVFVRKLYAVLLVTDWGIFSRIPDGLPPCTSLQKSHSFVNRRCAAKVVS